jgi:ribulose-phosphate 3-epimerase
MADQLDILVGVKSDPIEYRYSFEWLFRLMAEEGIYHLQLGSFFELYHLPDAYFLDLRRSAEAHGIVISSVFTAHRELGGFFRCDPHWEATARRSYERLIEVGALVGARQAGSGPGAVMRDQMPRKSQGLACYTRHMKELMHYAHQKGLGCLTIEPMSSLAEPPTLAEEIHALAEELMEYHRQHADTVPIGYCVDTSHGFADQDGNVKAAPMALLEAALPYLAELHVKNTDTVFGATFGFNAEERRRGIVDLEAVRGLLLKRADRVPRAELVAYLEISGPKLGRDYSDPHLETALRDSLRYVKRVFHPEPAAAPRTAAPEIVGAPTDLAPVRIAPSLMCCDLCRLEENVHRLEAAGLDLLHIDIMDARFTPNMPLGFEMFKQLRPRTQGVFDVHLMVEDNDFFVHQMAAIGAQWVSVHVESCTHLDRTLSLIREMGMRAGAALNPATPLNVLEYVLGRLDFVLVMTVNPGYAGQTLAPYGIKKIAACRTYLDAHGSNIPVEVDGNVSFEHIPEMVAAGADVLVAGTSSIFHAETALSENIARAQDAVRKGLLMRKERQTSGRQRPVRSS